MTAERKEMKEESHREERVDRARKNREGGGKGESCRVNWD